jgi:hypothetical protein
MFIYSCDAITSVISKHIRFLYIEDSRRFTLILWAILYGSHIFYMLSS